MNRRLAALPLAILAALGVGAGVARVDLPRAAFDLTYETLPLDDSGAVDRSAAPTRYWYKDQRSRIDNFSLDSGQPVLESSFIMDCDSSRMVQVSWRERTVMVTTFDEWKRTMEKVMELSSRYAGQAPGQPAARPSGTGGLVTSTTTWHDTTAQRDWFGLPARYAEYTESTTASADACYPADRSYEMRVWTTDLELPLCLPPFDLTAATMPAVADGGGGCTDRHESKVVGSPRRMGFLLRTETITTDEGTRRSSGFEVTSLSRAALADSLFQPPAGFQRIDMEALYGGMDAMDLAGGAAEPVSPKAEGVIRIGVALDLPPDAPADPRAVAREIADWIESHEGYDAVPLAARDRSGALAEAPGVEADYVLVYSLEEVKAGVSKKGLLGGAVGGALGARAAGGVMKLEVKGEYELAAVPGGERITREELDEERSTENPQEDLTETLKEAAGAALETLR
ncbi:MAG TPA: hypothetical protein VMR66_02990 [Gemmatimonadota bacterium]|nr:hypothetical protein [Gemmatimonadota bacterium]